MNGKLGGEIHQGDLPNSAVLPTDALAGVGTKRCARGDAIYHYWKSRTSMLAVR
jgi:hypothetical protein